MSLDVERHIGRLEGFLLAANAPDEVMSALYALCPLVKRKDKAVVMAKIEAGACTSETPSNERDVILGSTRECKAEQEWNIPEPDDDEPEGKDECKDLPAQVLIPGGQFEYPKEAPRAKESEKEAVRTRLQWTPEEKELLLARRKEGKSFAEIAAELGNGKTEKKARGMYYNLVPAESRPAGGLVRPRGNPNWGNKGGPVETSPLTVTSTYEENGHEVKVLPPGYAIGAEPGELGGRFTARPRGNS